MDFLPFWLANYFFFPEINYCVRTEIFKKCLPSPDSTDYLGVNNICLRFIYNFNVSGYLSYFLPIVASYGRIHNDSGNNNLTELLGKTMAQYVSEIIKYRTELLSGTRIHVFRDCYSNVIKSIDQHELGEIQNKILQFRPDNKVQKVDEGSALLWKKAITYLLKRRTLRIFLII